MPSTAPPRRTSRIRSRILPVTSVTLALISSSAGVTSLVLNSRSSASTAATHGASSTATRTGSNARTSSATCSYLNAPGLGSKPQAPPPSRTNLVRDVTLTLNTDLGTISIRLDGRSAPCAVNALVSLARSGFYAESTCDQLTTEVTWVVQCGDPSKTGVGGPGFRYADEHLPVGLNPSYPRGTVAMSNAAPDTNGSRFFIAYRDSDLEPYYPVVGRVTSGMEIIDTVAGSGTRSRTMAGPLRQPLRLTGTSVDLPRQ